MKHISKLILNEKILSKDYLFYFLAFSFLFFSEQSEKPLLTHLQITQVCGKFCLDNTFK